MTKPEWSERVTAAYVLLVLRRRNLLTLGQAKAAADVLGITADDALAAGRRDVDRPRLATTAAQPSTATAGPYRGGTLERRCPKCGRWFPATTDHFATKNDRGALVSMCHGCRKEYQRERYLTRAKEEAMEAAGVTFVLDEDQVGLGCAKCGAPLRAGEEVEGRTTLTHVACGDGAA